MAAIESTDEFTYQWRDEKFEELQRQGKCGEIQNNGRRCQAPIVEWFDLDPDRPYPSGPRVGACGTHQRHVGPRVTDVRTNVFERRVQQYQRDETNRVIRTLRAVGINVKSLDQGYGRTMTKKVVMENPAELLYALARLDVLEKFGINLETIERCPAAVPRYEGSNSLLHCMEFKGHYPATKHNNWEGREWVDPEPPKPEVSTEGEGGQFA